MLLMEPVTLLRTLLIDWEGLREVELVVLMRRVSIQRGWGYLCETHVCALTAAAMARSAKVKRMMNEFAFGWKWVYGTSLSWIESGSGADILCVEEGLSLDVMGNLDELT
jgi:hypothetical protein